MQHCKSCYGHATQCRHDRAFALFSFLYRNVSQNPRSVTTRIIDWYSEHKHTTKEHRRENLYVNKLTLILA